MIRVSLETLSKFLGDKYLNEMKIILTLLLLLILVVDGEELRYICYVPGIN